MNFTVTKKETATFEGKQIHAVLSTFHLVYYAELAARKLIKPYLGPGEEAVGFEIKLKHIAPSNIGEKVSVTAALVKKEGRKLLCKVVARNSFETIATGYQTQVLIRKHRLQRRRH